LGRGYDVVVSDAAGVDPDVKEALAFAVLGYELLRGRAAGVPGVTGARQPALLGALAPHDLAGLLARVGVETGGV
jgi:anhydro-N-acetylmuramic acid kinase